MAKGVMREGDMHTGHGAYPPSSAITEQNERTVLVNGIRVHYEFEDYVIHCDPDHNCHKPQAEEGFPTVYFEGNLCNYETNSTGCGAYAVSGSNVYVGKNT